MNTVRQCIFDFNGCSFLESAEFAECGVPANHHCHQLQLYYYFGNVFQVSSSAEVAVLWEWVQRGDSNLVDATRLW